MFYKTCIVLVTAIDTINCCHKNCTCLIKHYKLYGCDSKMFPSETHLFIVLCTCDINYINVFLLSTEDIAAFYFNVLHTAHSASDSNYSNSFSYLLKIASRLVYLMLST